MQNIRREAQSQDRKIKRAVACMLSVAMAAIIFWGIALANKAENEMQDMTIADSIRAAGDTLSASADPTKFTGTSAHQESKGYVQELSDLFSGEDDENEDWEDYEQPPKSLRVVTSAPESRTKVVEREEVIEHEVEERKSSLLEEGATKVIQEGSDGKRKVTIEKLIVDGEVRRETVLEEEILKQPVTEIILVGASGQEAAISPLQFDVELDENGIPVEYSSVLTNQVSTGYNLGSKAMGASGQGLSAGYVAVHPGEIPYGTKLYITSADNSFVYGFAIAADTGLGLLGNQIDVDLYYDTYLESCLHGKRNVNIYIL